MPEAGDLTLFSVDDEVAWLLILEQNQQHALRLQKREFLGSEMHKQSYTVKREGAVEGRSDNWGEVVTR